MYRCGSCDSPSQFDHAPACPTTEKPVKDERINIASGEDAMQWADEPELVE